MENVYELSRVILEPLVVIDQICSGSGSGIDPSSTDTTGQLERSVSGSFRSIFDSDQRIDQVPSLTGLRKDSCLRFEIPDESLVRFRCMIQDTGIGSELYRSENRDGKNLMYRENHILNGCDEYEFQEGGMRESLNERDLFYGVEVPGESDWYRSDLDESCRSTTSSSGAELELGLESLDLNRDNCCSSYGLRNFDGSKLESTKRKFPIAGKTHLGALLKLYNSDDNSFIKTGGIVEVIGVYGWTQSWPTVDLDETIPQQPTNSDTKRPDSQTGPNPPPTTIPCIHVIFCRYPPLPRISSSLLNNDRASVRDSLINYLARNFFNCDNLSAQYVLAALCSKIRSRSAGITVGALPLNLIYDEDSDPEPSSLSNFLSSIIPQSSTIPLTVSTLNERVLFPVSDQGSLQSGALQLGPGTLLFIDSSNMKEGQLNSIGVKNVEALQKLIEDAKLLYSFPYSNYEFEVQLRIILVSSGSKTFLNGFWSVPVNGSLKALKKDQEIKVPTEEELIAWRCLIQDTCTKEIVIPESLSSEIQNTFVTIRRGAMTATEADKAMSQEELGKRLELSRLIGLIDGKGEVGLEDWQLACKMEKIRKVRLEIGKK
ncbi:putative alanine racemase-domain-containing protein [Phakopsora pachyrhizi]|uniref:Alanine racemase-domain-containing protein n=1 Tax=Phakopsora pachyrhizi TaxID=170000 RepID=A0AAV0BLS6_PHAPC|nr:putative alanine racemase-domain-containing protein [Phakopsora pachyrhizi]CAH7688209.1 putative alanine racemase-domain-containing protein [Phakopsora pachyrhizi]